MISKVRTTSVKCVTMFINHIQDHERQGKTNNRQSLEEINALDSMWFHGIGPWKRKKIVEKLGKSK